MSSTFIIVYDPGQANVVAASNLYYWKPPQDTSSSAVETNQHFVPRFSQPQFNVLRLLREQQDWSSSTSVIQPETNTHFIGRFNQPQFARFNYNTAARDTSSSPVETNTHFIGKFTPASFQRGFLYNTAAFDFSSSAVETNVHFIGKFSAPQFNVLVALRQQQDWASSTAPPQSETNTHFIGRFTQPTYARFNYNSAAFDFNSSAVETNQHFIARYTPPNFARFNYNVPAADLPAQPETNTHFVPRYSPVRHNVLPLLRSNIAADFSSSAVETNPHFIGKFKPPIFNVLVSLRQLPAIDLPPAIVPFNIRIFGYSGVVQIPVINPRQDSKDSFFALYQPYEFASLGTSSGGTPVTIGPSGLPAHKDLSKILRVEVPDGRSIRFEVNPPGRAVAASAASPLLTGVLHINWGPGYSMSIIDASTAP